MTHGWGLFIWTTAAWLVLGWVAHGFWADVVRSTRIRRVRGRNLTPGTWLRPPGTDRIQRITAVTTGAGSGTRTITLADGSSEKIAEGGWYDTVKFGQPTITVRWPGKGAHQ